MEIETSYNFRQVTDKLTTSGIVRPETLQSLASQGYQAVVNLLPDSSEHAVANEQEIVESQDIEYVYIPVDFGQPGLDDFETFCNALDKMAGRKIHIHCAANYRVSAFFSLYEIKRGRWSVDQAMDFIRDIWNPAEYPAWQKFVADAIEQPK